MRQMDLRKEREIFEEAIKITESPEVIRDVMEFHRDMTSTSVEKMLRRIRV